MYSAPARLDPPSAARPMAKLCVSVSCPSPALLPTNTTQPTGNGNNSAAFHNEGVEYPQYVLEVGYGLPSGAGIVSTNNDTLNLMGIKVVFWLTNQIVLPADNVTESSPMVQNTNPDACITVLLEDVELRLNTSAANKVIANFYRITRELFRMLLKTLTKHDKMVI